MTCVDFLGNVMEVGDEVVYAPRGKNNDGLVLATVIALTGKEVDDYGSIDGKYQKIGTKMRYAPRLRPTKESGSYTSDYFRRDRKWVSDTGNGESGYIDCEPRHVYLSDTAHMMLVKKGGNNVGVDTAGSVS